MTVNYAVLRQVIARAPKPDPHAPPDYERDAVCLLLADRTDTRLWAIQKTDSEGYHWRDQVALPGGRIDPADADATDALEVGLYQLLLAAYSDQLAQMTERRLLLEARLPLPEATREEPAEEASPTVEEETPTVAATEAPPAAEKPVPPPAPGPGIPVGVIVGAAVVVTAILASGIGLWWRRRQR